MVLYELVKFRMEKIDVCTIVWVCVVLGIKKHRYMVWNPLSCVWFGFGNSQHHFVLGLS